MNPTRKITSLESSVEKLENYSITNSKLRKELSNVYLNTTIGNNTNQTKDKVSTTELLTEKTNIQPIPKFSKEKIIKINTIYNLANSKKIIKKLADNIKHNKIRTKINNTVKNQKFSLLSNTTITKEDLVHTSFNPNSTKIVKTATSDLSNKKSIEGNFDLSKPLILEFIGSKGNKCIQTGSCQTKQTFNDVMFNELKSTIEFSHKSNSPPKQKSFKFNTAKTSGKKIYIPLNLKLSQNKLQIKYNSQSKPKIERFKKERRSELNKEKNYTLSKKRLNTNNEVEITLYSEEKQYRNPIPITLISSPLIQKPNPMKNIKLINPFPQTSIPCISKSKTQSHDHNCIDKENALKKYSRYLKKNELEELKLVDSVYYFGNIPNLLEETGKISPKSRSSDSRYKFPRPNSDMNFLLTANDEFPFSLHKAIATDGDLFEEKYDDEDGNYLINIRDHINFRYEIISELGRGSFGQAIKCYDHKMKENVCIKIIKNQKKFNKQAKIEIRLLEHIKANDINNKEQSNIVKIIEYFVFRKHICIVFELLDINLYELLKSQDFVGLEMNVIRKLAVQILQSLMFLKKHSIVHCDLKPENILLKQNSKSSIKVIDFGSSCFDNEKLYTYIQSRFYRAPEIILGLGYGIEIDMWSFGCIIVELFTGIPIFPGENERDQLGYMMEYLGQPDPGILELSRKCHQFFDNEGNYLQIPNSRGKIRHPNTKKISNFLKGSDESFIDLVKKCFIWDPTKRIKPEEAMVHPWISPIFNKDTIKYFRNNLKIKTNTSINNNSEENNKILNTYNKPNYTTTETSVGKYTLTPKAKKSNNSIKNLKYYSGEESKHIPNSNTNRIIKKLKTKISTLTKGSETRYLGAFKSKINLILDVNINIKSKDKKVTIHDLNTANNKKNKKMSFYGH